MLDKTQPVQGADLIVLSEHVDYWDRLGVEGPVFFGGIYRSAEAILECVSSRIDLHPGAGHRWQERNVWGTIRRRPRAAINDALKSPKAQLTLSAPVRDGDQLTVQVDLPAGSGQGVLYVALAEGFIETQVLRGENSGHSLSHVGVLRKLIKVGTVKKEEALSKDLHLKLDADMGAALGCA